MMDAPGHITVGYDGSPLSELAVYRAIRRLQATAYPLCHVVTVAEDQGTHVRMPDGRVLHRWAALDSLHHIIGGMVRSLGLVDQLGTQVVTHLRTGDPARTLVDLAYRYHSDELIVGAHGATGGPETRVGSVAQDVLDLSDIPVHVESAVMNAKRGPEASAMRWAYVFGGPQLKREHFGTFGNRSASA